MAKKSEKRGPKPKPKKPGPKPKGKRQLTREIRARKIIKALVVDGKGKVAAVKAAGYADNTAEHNASEIIDKIVGENCIRELMDRKGLNDERLLGVLDQGLNATKVISAMVVKGGPDSLADEQDGMKDAHSMTKDFVDTEDYAIRHKYLETGLKLRGHLREKVDHTVTVETFEQKMRRIKGLIE